MNKKALPHIAGMTFWEMLIVVVVIGLLAAIAIPNFVKARTTASKNICNSYCLPQLVEAKKRWAQDNKKQAGDTPAWGDLVGTDKYIKSMPACPAGGAYSLNNLATKPTCSIGGEGHTL
jgi:prepilin-type N-terminal cleavage/methylation domain-containing protein